VCGSVCPAPTASANHRSNSGNGSAGAVSGLKRGNSVSQTRWARSSRTNSEGGGEDEDSVLMGRLSRLPPAQTAPRSDDSQRSGRIRTITWVPCSFQEKSTYPSTLSAGR
jgi:hypothetical protein